MHGNNSTVIPAIVVTKFAERSAGHLIMSKETQTKNSQNEHSLLAVHLVRQWVGSEFEIISVHIKLFLN